MASLVGQQLGKYEIIERLGWGGMAEVYKAYQPALDRFVAIKVIFGHFADVPEFVARFKREARNIAQLRHAHIVQVFDFDAQDDLYYMVMEYVQGGTLHQRIQQRGALPIADVLHVGVALADALAYAHQRGMIHRDIKPGNVMFADYSCEHPVLTDFGIARIVGDSVMTTSGFIGTPGYTSPEVGRGEPLDERADIYSMGVMLFEMITGRMPYYGDTPFAVIMKHINEPLPSLRQFNADLPAAVEEIVYKAMAKRSDLRYQTAGELRDALHETLFAETYALAAIKRGPLAIYAAANVVAISEAETSILPKEAIQPLQSKVADGVITSQSELDKPRRRRLLSFALAFLGLLLTCGFVVMWGNGAFSLFVQPATNTQPALVIIEDSPTPTASPMPPSTRTVRPTDEPPTPTQRFIVGPHAAMVTNAQSTPSETPSPTPTPTNPPPRPTSVPPTDAPAQSPAGGGGVPPTQPGNGNGNGGGNGRGNGNGNGNGRP